MVKKGESSTSGAKESAKAMVARLEKEKRESEQKMTDAIARAKEQVAQEELQLKEAAAAAVESEEIPIVSFVFLFSSDADFFVIV
jgi:polyhydroxyalkanoate synthesis regulator phasin